MKRDISSIIKDNDQHLTAARQTLIRVSLGKEYELSVNDVERLRELLTHSDFLYRKGAMLAIIQKIRDLTEIYTILHHAVQNDVNVSVRILAVQLLGQVFSNTKEYEVGYFLQTIIVDESNSLKMRSLAYQSLLDVEGDQLALTSELHSQRFPDSIDQALLHRYS